VPYVIKHSRTSRGVNGGWGWGVLASLADHLVGLEEEGWGDGQAEGLGGFEVDDERLTSSHSLRLPCDCPRRLQEPFTGEHNIFPSCDEPPLLDNSLLIDQEEGPLGDPEL